MEDEIGLDEFQSSMRGSPSTATRPYSRKDEAKEGNIEEMRQKSLEDAWGQSSESEAQAQAQAQAQAPPAPSQSEGFVENEKKAEREETGTFAETLSAPVEAAETRTGDVNTAEQNDLSTLSVEELQAELERRKKESA